MATATKKRTRNLWQTLKARQSFEFDAVYKNGKRKPMTAKIKVIGHYEDDTNAHWVLFANPKQDLAIVNIEGYDVFDREDDDGNYKDFNRNQFCFRFLYSKTDLGVMSANGIPILDADGDDLYTQSLQLKKHAVLSFEAVRLLWEVLDDSSTENLLKDANVVHTTADEVVATNKRISTKRIKELFEQGYSININGKTANKYVEDLGDDKHFSTICEYIRNWNPNFHKAGMTLLQYEDDYAIFGFDDGQYFGCLLPPECKPRTVTAALDCLKPKGLTGHYQRQGEWFVQRLDQDIKTWNCVGATFIGEDVRIEESKTTIKRLQGCLPRDDTDSNCHEFTAAAVTYHEDGTFFFENLELTHNEHRTIKMEGWCKVIKNRAVRSVSAEGVD
jgi:hypothetical protein